ncbi:hypothetical protein AX774_g1566 [Zancudomyces culisetae]|uniref:Uncharacterized protein n=1 Tax=Zancudomyces culisetae TaxID=1213189 RepID=A0A1R1PV89_ZANCU|nr:hypothetical protein AX774_g1566 [Zancudomyces culisetae]|eukprot:OMH84895.1 hypothetical protein AX774_g1566 [Zancudomyces culisetae]
MDINRVKTKLSYIPEGKRPTEYIEGMGLGLKELLKNVIGIEEIAELYEQVIRSRSQEIDNVTGRVDYVVEFMNYFQEQLQLLEYECQEIKLTPDSKRKFNAINKMYRDVKLFQGMIEVFGDDCEAAVEDNGISYSDIRVDELINGENDDNFERLVVKPRDIVRNGYESKWIQCEEFTPKMRQLLEVLEEYVNEEKSKEDESIKAKGMTKEKYEKYIAGLFETFGMEIISVMNVTLEKNKSRNETRKRESDKDVKIPWEMVFCAIVMLDSKDISINELESIVLKGIGEEGKDKEKRVLEKGQEKECVIEKLCEFVGEMEKKGIKEFYEQYKMIREFVELQGGKENAARDKNEKWSKRSCGV